MRHRRHGAADALDTVAGREGLPPCRVEAVVEVGDGDEGANQDEKEECRPSVDPYLRESGSKAEVRCEVGCLVRCGSRCVLRGVVVSHLVVASGERRRKGRKGVLLVLRGGHGDGEGEETATVCS